MKVTGAIYEVLEAHNCAWTFETHFMIVFVKWRDDGEVSESPNFGRSVNQNFSSVFESIGTSEGTLRVILNFHRLPRRNYRVLQFRKQASAEPRTQIAESDFVPPRQFRSTDWRRFAGLERISTMQGRILCRSMGREEERVQILLGKKYRHEKKDWG